jgi:hypothetical protein
VCDSGNHNTQEPSQVFKSRDMGRGWYWLLWSTGRVKVKGFLNELQGLLRLLDFETFKAKRSTV